jgi:hypothetical protein
MMLSLLRYEHFSWQNIFNFPLNIKKLGTEISCNSDFKPSMSYFTIGSSYNFVPKKNSKKWGLRISYVISAGDLNCTQFFFSRNPGGY